MHCAGAMAITGRYDVIVYRYPKPRDTRPVGDDAWRYEHPATAAFCGEAVAVALRGYPWCGFRICCQGRSAREGTIFALGQMGNSGSALLRNLKKRLFFYIHAEPQARNCYTFAKHCSKQGHRHCLFSFTDTLQNSANMTKNKDKSSKKKPTKPSKSSKPTKSDVDGSTLSLTASSQAIDPSLALLFGSSVSESFQIPSAQTLHTNPDLFSLGLSKYHRGLTPRS